MPLTKHSLYFLAYLFLSMTYLALQMFQGLSFLDIGIYLSGYQYFNDEPFATQYLAQWLLSYSVSGWLCHVFSIKTFLGLRVMHLVYIAFMQSLIYCYLCKNGISSKYIIIGLGIATLGHFGSYTEINYNDYSVFLLTCAIFLYHHGLKREKSVAIFLSGIVIGVAFFFRITNLTFIVLPLIAVLLSRFKIVAFSNQKQLSYFFLGTVIGVAATLSVLKIVGLYEVFATTITDIFSIGTDSEDAHNLKNIVLCTYELYKGEVAGFSCVLLLSVAIYAIKKSNVRTFYKQLIAIGFSLTIILCIYLREPASNITVGISLLGFTLCLYKQNNTNIQTLYTLSVLIPMVFPIGSNGGPEFLGNNLAFVTMPLAIHVLYHSMSKTDKAYTSTLRWSLVAIAVAFIYTNTKRPMMEDGNRLQCTQTTRSPQSHSILTSKENADIINAICLKIKPFIPENSYLVCTFSPTIVSLLDCKPYAVFTTVFTTNAMNDRYIQRAYQHTGKLPLILSYKNRDPYVPEKDQTKDQYVEKCLHRLSPYRTVYEDDNLILTMPIAQEGNNNKQEETTL